MRIAVMAAGAVGGYFGGRMAAAGHDVAFIARGAHRDAIRRDGLKIESASATFISRTSMSPMTRRQVGPVDVVLFAVKLWDTETAGEQTRPLVGPDTRVITLQNGVDSVERLAPILGDEAVIGGRDLCRHDDRATGVIRHTGTIARIRCGRLDRRPDAVLAGYVEQMKAANARHHADGQYASRPLEEIRAALGHLRHHGEHAPAARRHSRRRGHAGLLLQADARDDGCRPCGRRRVSAGLSSGAGSFGGGLSANDESLDGERPRGGQPPRTRLARRQGGRRSLAVSMVCRPRPRRQSMRSLNLTGRG